MKLTLEEFKLIRPVQWRLMNCGTGMYNTPINQTDTQLFWLDFMSLIFAPKFKKQNGVPLITSFDITQPVLITDDLELKLPTQVETAVYFANNTYAPVQFSFNIGQILVAIISILIIIILVISEHFIGKKIKTELLI